MEAAANALSVLELEISHFFAADPAAKIKNVLAERSKSLNMSVERYMIWVISTVDDAVELASHLPLPDEKATAMIKALGSFQEQFLAASRLTTIGEMQNKIGSAMPDLLSAWANTVSVANIAGAFAIDRGALAEVTRELIDRVEGSDMGGYQKKALLLKLNAVARVLGERGYCTDDEIRRRVKAVYADYCAEFNRFDKEHESTREAMLRWALLVSKPGIFALALAADVTAVAGLLPPPA